MHPDSASAMSQRLKELYPALTQSQLDVFHRGFEHLDADDRLVKEIIDRNFLGRGEFNWQRLLDIIKWESDKHSLPHRINTTPMPRPSPPPTSACFTT